MSELQFVVTIVHDEAALPRGERFVVKVGLQTVGWVIKSPSREPALRNRWIWESATGEAGDGCSLDKGVSYESRSQAVWGLLSPNKVCDL